MLAFIKLQSNRYKTIKTEIVKLEKEIKYQEEIKKQHLIPRKYKPNQTPHIHDPSGKIQSEFNTAYEQLFFKHLNKIINANTVASEIKKIAFGRSN